MDRATIAVVQHLIYEFTDFAPCFLEYLQTAVSYGVVLPHFPLDQFRVLPQIALFCQTVQSRVKSTRTEVVAVPTQFLNYPNPEDWFFRSMIQDVDLHKSEEELSIYHDSTYRYCNAILYPVVTSLINISSLKTR